MPNLSSSFVLILGWNEAWVCFGRFFKRDVQWFQMDGSKSDPSHQSSLKLLFLVTDRSCVCVFLSVLVAWFDSSESHTETVCGNTQIRVMSSCLHACAAARRWTLLLFKALLLSGQFFWLTSGLCSCVHEWDWVCVCVCFSSLDSESGIKHS